MDEDSPLSNLHALPSVRNKSPPQQLFRANISAPEIEILERGREIEGGRNEGREGELGSRQLAWMRDIKDKQSICIIPDYMRRS